MEYQLPCKMNPVVYLAGRVDHPQGQACPAANGHVQERNANGNANFADEYLIDEGVAQVVEVHGTEGHLQRQAPAKFLSWLP